MPASMPAMLLLALQLSLIETRLRLVCMALTSLVGRFPLYRLPLIRERLLRLGAHRGPLKGFRRLPDAPLGALHGLARFGWIVAEERNLFPFADNESQDFLIGRLRAEDDAGDAVPSALNVLRQPDPELAVVIYGQGGTVFSSLMPALRRARMRLDIAADMARLGFAPRRILAHIAPRFRNREGECMRATICASIRRSRGSSRRFSPSGMRYRRSPSPARGMSPILGKACSCWTSRGGCSASRDFERRVGLRGNSGHPNAATGSG